MSRELFDIVGIRKEAGHFLYCYAIALFSQGKLNSTLDFGGFGFLPGPTSETNGLMMSHDEPEIAF